jgi:hypothetical protein
MKEIKTEIDINAPIDKVWEVLTDFKAYPNWNPFIVSLEGDVYVGSVFKVVLHPPGSKPMTFKPRCLQMELNKEFIWLGKLFFPGIFDGKHIFELSELGPAKTKFVQREEFKGLLVPLLWKQLDNNTRKGFELMNQKLKEEAEK